MKSTIVKNKEDQYPCLKEYNEDDKPLIVLFTDRNKGFVIHDDRKTCLVIGSDGGGKFAEGAFHLFEGTLELENG